MGYMLVGPRLEAVRRAPTLTLRTRSDGTNATLNPQLQLDPRNCHFEIIYTMDYIFNFLKVAQFALSLACLSLLVSHSLLCFVYNKGAFPM